MPDARGWIKGKRGASGNNRRAVDCELTSIGRKQWGVEKDS